MNLLALWIPRISPASLLLYGAALCLTTACAVLPEGESTQDQLLVVIDQGSTAAHLGNPSHPYRRQTRYKLDPSSNRVLDRLARQHSLRRNSGWPIPAIGAHCEVFAVPENTVIEDLIKAIELDPAVRLAQPMAEYEVMAQRSTPTYNDPYLKLQHGFNKMHVADAHRWSQGAGVKIAVIDTGIARAHEDLQKQVVGRKNFVPGKHRGRTNVHHGTAMAGVIASVANNGSGIVGIAPKAMLLDLRACWSHQNDHARSVCSSLSLARALSSAIEHKADVINLSLAGPPDRLVSRLVQAAHRGGAVIIAAAGPQDGSGLHFPASMSEVLAADLARSEQRKALIAPGEDVLTTVPGGRYDFVSGASVSAAHVSGLVALLLAHSQLEAGSVASLLETFRVRDSIDACAVLAAGNDSVRCPEGNSLTLKTH